MMDVLSMAAAGPFTCALHMGRVVFGAGCLQQLGAELDRLGLQRALVLSTPEQEDEADRVAALLGARAVGVFAGAAMHVPVETVQSAQAVALRLRADCTVAIGGGSTTGLAKALALRCAMPIVAIPTTYAGSEVTTVYGITEGGVKKTGRDPSVLPRTVIYDPELTLTLPLELTLSSALNAVAHAVEGLYAHDGNPIVSLMAEEGIRESVSSLEPLSRNPLDLTARSGALYGAWLCGVVLGHVSMGLHHKLCHTLGGSFDLPHAQVHSVILPHAIAYNAAAAPGAIARLNRALDCTDAPRKLQALAASHGVPTSLRALGMSRLDLERAADLATQTPYPNPRPVVRAALRDLLERAYEGASPSA